MLFFWRLPIYCPDFRHPVIPISRYYEVFEIVFLGKMGNMGNMGLMGSEIRKISSEQNKINSTLF